MSSGEDGSYLARSAAQASSGAASLEDAWAVSAHPAPW
eukprot:CAMPEP_0184744832 /NCGR_PEP_ID=MMETSP0315-20130426/7561_1 /TAXON_ID=101924 /ORGANISM="Rhodosorus marinus, Strain UTEX LB 2760" /LENGTH=37 /DNA_ID= /DNA_START= /DNA_END= /DNA_ORIENTATION=